MPKKDHLTLAVNYPVCELADCPCASRCLHQIAYAELMKTCATLILLNPTRCVKDSTCPHFRNAEPVTYARGFASMQKKMFPEQYATFRHYCMARFGRNGYFMRRRGELALPPKEQETVRQALLKAGVTDNLPFDSYEQQPNWVD